MILYRQEAQRVKYFSAKIFKTLPEVPAAPPVSRNIVGFTGGHGRQLMAREAAITRRIDDQTVYYSVYWSPLTEADKYRIISSVPAESGMYELYYKDAHERLHLMIVSWVWYGGLRSRLRRITDPELTADPLWRSVLESYPCYYRFSRSTSVADMQDILYFFDGRYRPGTGKTQHSGRFREIYLEENSEDKIVTI